MTLSGWDPDDQLRLVQLRDFIAGQGWFDNTQYRLNTPDGAPMHWSRLIELPLALIIVAATPIFGQPVAEMIAGTAVPLLVFGAIACIVSRIAARIGTPEAGVIAALLTLISPALIMQLRPMRIDHHGWQIFFAVLALWTMFWPDKRRGGIVLGLSLAVWLHISLEGAPLTAAFFALLGWRWIMEKANGRRLAWTIASFAVASVLLFAGTQRQWLTYCDTVSPPHIVAVVIAAAIMLAAIAVAPDQRRLRLAASIAAGVTAVGTILAIAPQCAGGAFGGLDPLIREYWYVHINEGLPVWQQSWHNALVLLAMSMCGIAALVAVVLRPAGSAPKDVWLSGYFLIYATVLSLLVFRTVAVSVAFAIPLIAVWIDNLFQQYRRSQIPARRIGLVALMLFLTIPGPVVAQLYSFGEKITVSGQTPKNAAVEAATEACEAPPSIAALAALPKARIVAPLDMGPTILLTTPHQVLASSHHRNVRGMHDHIEIFRSSPDRAKTIIARRGITHIISCAGEAEMEFYSRKDPSGLGSQLAKDNAPAWLEPLTDMGHGIKVWRVR